MEQLRWKRDEIDRALSDDSRDWGVVCKYHMYHPNANDSLIHQVTDAKEIERRLKMIEDSRLLHKRIAELEV